MLSDASSRLASAIDLARQFALEPTYDAVYVSGSIVAGLGSSTSDVDLFVVISEGTSPPERALQLQSKSSRVDVEYVEWHELEYWVQKLLEIRLHRENVRDVWIPQNKLDDVVRLSYAQTIKSTPRLDDLLDQLRTQHEVLRRFLVARWAVEAVNCFEDLMGAVNDRNWGFAVYVGQDYLSACGKALTSSLGDLYFGRKWVYDQLARSAGEHFPLELFRFFQTGAWAMTEQPDFDQLITFTQSLLGRACAAIFVPEVASVDWHAKIPSGDGPKRSRNFLPIPIEDGLLLTHEGSRQMLLKPNASAVWALADGHDNAVLEEDMSVAFSASNGSHDFSSIIGRLKDSGALVFAE